MTYVRAVFAMMFACFLAVTALAQPNAPAKPLSPFEQTLVNNEKSYIEAVQKGDTAFFKRTLSDDFSIVSFDGQLSDRQEMLDQFGEGGLDLMPYDMKVVGMGENAGIVTYDVVVRVPPSEDQGPPPRYQHFSTVWVKQEGAWKMKFQQMSISHWGDW